ncbi:MAG: transcription termination factor Rho [Planctomycetaceae bacterium]
MVSSNMNSSGSISEHPSADAENLGPAQRDAAESAASNAQNGGDQTGDVRSDRQGEYQRSHYPGRGERGDNGDGDTSTGRRKRRRRHRNKRPGEGDTRQQRGPQQQRRGRGQPIHRPRPVGQNGEEVTGTIEGVLELHPKGYGFLRDPSKNYAAQESDAFVSSSLIEKHNLREGILIRGEVGPGTKGQGPRLRGIESIDGRTLEEYAKIKVFEELTPINPFEQVRLETGPRPVTMRVMDLLTPIGKGQRALIVAPPRTGKTMLLQDIADAVSVNHPELHLIVLLIDERPEEVTEMQRRVKGEVIASSMDRDVESHVRLSQLIIERGKRIAEAGGEVFILLDSITRTARAFNKWVGNSGRTATGGLDIRALDIPKKLFGTARRFDEGGSLTVTATALIDTGSRMDESIFQEFKGTGNMELVLSRDLADRRIWPAIDVTLSGTRREEKILPPDVLEGVTMLRRSLVSLNPVEAMEQLIRTLERFPTNAEFLVKVRSIL